MLVLFNRINDPRPAFICVPAGGESDQRREIKLAHTVFPGADAKRLNLLTRWNHVVSDEMRQFYARANGMVLFRQGDAMHLAGLQLFGVHAFEAQTENVRENYDFIFKGGYLPFGIGDFICIAAVPCSAHRLLLIVKGEHRGRIFQMDYDPSYDPDRPFAENFSDFLEIIAGDPAALLSRFGGYTRYTDHQTDIQWYPIEYRGR